MPETFDYEARILTMVDSLVDIGQLDDALSQLQLLTARFPGSLEGHLRLGKIYCAKAEREKAETAFRKALRLDSGRMEAYRGLAALSDRATAIDLLTRALTIVPGDIKTLSQLARTYREAGMLLDCEMIIREWSEQSNDDPELFLELSKLLEADGQLEEAEKSLLSALEVSRMHESVVAQTIDFYDRVGKPAEALKLIQRAYAAAPAGASVTIRAAELFAKYGQPMEAARVLEMAVREGGNQQARVALERLRASSRPPRNEKELVFITEYPRGRTYKIASALKREGFRTVLLCYHAHDDFDARQHFDHVQRFENNQHAVILAREYNPLAYHIASAHGDQLSVEIIRDRPGPCIFDPYDITDGVILSENIGAINELQRFAIENADGMCCRDLRFQHLLRELGYRRNGPRILFEDYCEGKQQPSPKSLDELHLVVGGFIGTSRGGQDGWGYFELGRMLAAQKVHLHIYPHPMQALTMDTEFAEFAALQRETGYVHLHKPTKMEDAVTEFSKYHAGLCIYWPSLNKREVRDYTAVGHKLCGSARLMDYLDAGLPAIVNPELTYQYWKLRRYGAAIPASLDLFRDIKPRLTEFLSSEGLRSRLERARNAHMLSRHIPRLIEFYRKFR